MNTPMKWKNAVAPVLLLVVVVCAAALLIKYCPEFRKAIVFSPLTVQSVSSVLAGLFVVALMTERAVEVIISVQRDADADLLVGALAQAQASYLGAQGEIPVIPLKVEVAKRNQEMANRKLLSYRADTKQMAYSVSFVVGILTSLVGVRGLSGLLQGASGGWFGLVDVIVTGSVIAGGSDWIHQMMNSAIDFFNMLSANSNKKAVV